MSGDEHFFMQSIKGKIIVATVLACVSLLLAWSVSRIAFKKMLGAVEKISAPNDKLRLVNELTYKVAQLDQVQKSAMLNNPANYYSLFRETKKLTLTIDTLEALFAGDLKQEKRIRSLKVLLIDHDKLFINYLRVREGLVNNQSFSRQVKLVNELVRKSSRQNDSTATTERKTSTTTLIDSEKRDSINASHGFFSKLFGKKKPALQKPSYKVVDVEVNVRHDTLAIARQDSILQGMGTTMQKLESSQLRRSALFVNRESDLNQANSKLIHRILSILKQVEAEAVSQIADENNAARKVVNTSVSRISYIILGFLLLATSLLYFILTDISRSNQYRKDLELARDEAEYHGKAKHRFLSNMSHEIRTPLQSIIGFAEQIKQQEELSLSAVDAIYQSSEHLMQIVNEVLDYNLIISGKFTITHQPFSMAGLINEVLSVLSPQAARKAIRLHADFESPPNDYVEGDAFRLKQILFNLLGNAIKFTDEGEVKLSIISDQENGGLHYFFAVSDTGIGISEKNISKIFHEFEQVQEPDNRHLKGTGLGLTISKALIETMGGHISVTSKLGDGTCFTFDLMFKKTDDLSAGPLKHLDRRPISGAAKIWIIDDDQFILDLCSTILERHAVKYLCFNSPLEVLKTAFDPAVKTILLDIRMPEMNGIELCRLLRQTIPEGVAIYALTAQVLPGEQQLVLSQGFDGLLLKPFREHELLAVLTPRADITELIPKFSLDIGKIKKMTFGDQQQLEKILKRFTGDCTDDIAKLHLSAASHDNEQLILLVHRIAGRAAQIGAVELAADFRRAEIDFSKNELSDREKTITIRSLTERLQVLIKQVRTSYLSDNTTERSEN